MSLDRKIPGWGNSFYPNTLDPAWRNMDALIRAEHSKEAKRLDEITDLIRSVKRRVIFPNAAAYTAIVAELLELEMGVEAVLFIAGRLPAWAELYNDCSSNGTNEIGNVGAC
jgi:citrate synthase